MDTVVRKDQERIAQWLTKRAPELGEVYGAAVRLMGDPEYPGRTRFICHAARDICNRLPDVVDVLVLKPNLHNQLNKLSDLWSRHKLQTVELGRLTPEEPQNADSTTREVAVPLDVFRQIDLVVKNHRLIPIVNRERATRMFETVAPESAGGSEVLLPQTDQWIELKHWFEGHAHAGLRDRTVLAAELQSKFETFETHLSKIAGEEFYEGVEELDEILEDTNG